VTEPPELEALDVLGPFELGEKRHERMPAMEVVAPVRPDDQQPLGTQVADEEPDEVARGTVRPMEVLEDEDSRSFRSQSSKWVDAIGESLRRWPLQPQLEPDQDGRTLVERDASRHHNYARIARPFTLVLLRSRGQDFPSRMSRVRIPSPAPPSRSDLRATL
jgi:hypothetical protein